MYLFYLKKSTNNIFLFVSYNFDNIIEVYKEKTNYNPGYSYFQPIPLSIAISMSEK